MFSFAPQILFHICRYISIFLLIIYNFLMSCSIFFEFFYIITLFSSLFWILPFNNEARYKVSLCKEESPLVCICATMRKNESNKKKKKAGESVPELTRRPYMNSPFSSAIVFNLRA